LTSAVQQFFTMLALQLWESRIEELAGAYSVPLIVALPGVEPGYVVLSSRAQIEHFFRLKCEGLLNAGIPHLGVDVTESEAIASDRLSALVEWYYLTPGGERAGQTTARYYLERQGASYSVQMIEFERIAFPAIVDWFRTAGDPAETPPAARLH
jgi:hypothetical protein